jgi:glycosyltransferase involved in cell wall biosynthesis
MREQRPRFSVLLPTRNGAAYLPGCIESVLEQDYNDFELVVSDNANSDGTGDVLARYASDPRLRIVRSEQVLDVVENWNKALAASRGDFLLMIGDDDSLLPHYFTRLEQVLARHGPVDCVTYNAYSYIAEGSFEGDKRSYYREGLYTFNSAWQSERMLTDEERPAIVRDMFHFRPTLPLNMQTTVVSRRQAEEVAHRVKGGMFQAPFPDHYALNALLLLSESWVVMPEKLLVVGISPKSYGHFVYAHQQSAGLEYLGISTDFQGRLPGNELHNNMHVWLNMLLRDFPDQLQGVRIDRGAYVRRQAYAWVLQHRAGALSRRDLLARFRLLSLRDWCSLAASATDGAVRVHLRRMLSGAGFEGAQTVRYGLKLLPTSIPDIKAFAHWISGSMPNDPGAVAP